MFNAIDNWIIFKTVENMLLALKISLRWHNTVNNNDTSMKLTH